MKQEAPYILEWVSYHKALGFELIIADNGGDDETSSILTALHNSRVITRLDFRFRKKTPQISAYRAIVRYAKLNKIDIIGFLDTDEFFSRDIPVGGLSPEVGSEYIISEFYRLNATQLSYFWLCYGSKTEITDLNVPVLERFSHHSTSEVTREARFAKSFSLVNELFGFSNIFFLGPKILSPHHLHSAMKRWYLDGERIKKFSLDVKQVTHTHGAILHYRIKTMEEYQDKVNRGRADIQAEIYTDRLFLKFDLNEEKSQISQDIIDQLKERIFQLRELIGNFHEIDINVKPFSTLKMRLMSSGISDIQNHKPVYFLYKRLKKIQ